MALLAMWNSGGAQAPSFLALCRVGSVAALAGLGALLTGNVPEVAMLALAVAAGLPHGAFDHEVAGRVFVSRGRRWWQPFLLGYLSLLAAMLTLWWAVPVVALSLFLGLSILHFGNEDRPVRRHRLRLASILAHGMIPIIVPAVIHPVLITELLSILVGPKAYVLQSFFAGPLAILWITVAIVVLIDYVCSEHNRAYEATADLISIVGLFVVASPLVAFSIYFALIHTPRAMRHIFSTFNGHSCTNLIRRSLPLTLGGFTVGMALFLIGPAAVDTAVVRTSFLLLSALTVPHMWLEFLDRRMLLNDFSPYQTPVAYCSGTSDTNN